MILGTTHAVVEIYSGPTLQDTLTFKQITARQFLTPKNQIKREYINPYTKKIEYKVEGYLFEEEITIASGDWRRGGVKAWADENNIAATESEIHKAIRLISYSNDGYKILYWSHADAKTLGFAGEEVTVTENRNFGSIWEDKLTLNFKGKNKRSFVLIPEFSLWKLIWGFESGKTGKLIWDFETGKTGKEIWGFESGKTSKEIWSFGNRIEDCENFNSQFLLVERCEGLHGQLILIEKCENLQSQVYLIERCDNLTSQISMIEKCENQNSQFSLVERCDGLFQQASRIENCESLMEQS